MKLIPVKPRDTAIGGVVGGAKWRYDPIEHADGMEVSPEVGRVLLGSGHWTEVQPQPKRGLKWTSPGLEPTPKDPPSFRPNREAATDDSLSE